MQIIKGRRIAFSSLLQFTLSGRARAAYRPGIIMPLHYSRAFGLTLTCDVAVPGLIPSAGGEPDVRIHLGEFPAGIDPASQVGPVLWSEGGDPDQETDAVAVRSVENGASLLLAYGDGTRFLVPRNGTEIWASAPRGVSLETTATYLLGPVFGLVLRLRGITCIHASVVAVEAAQGLGAIAFIGPAGAGKSTIAAAFALRGHRVVSDDIAVLVPEAGHWTVESATPSIRLWDDSVALLFGNSTALPLMAPGWEKRQLDLTSLRGAFAVEGRLPFVAAYVLDTDGRSGARAEAQRLTPRDALMTLVPNTYANVLLDRTMRAAEFQTLSSIVSTVPVWRIHAPTNATELAEFCESLSRGTLVTDFIPDAR